MAHDQNHRRERCDKALKDLRTKFDALKALVASGGTVTAAQLEDLNVSLRVVESGGGPIGDE